VNLSMVLGLLGGLGIFLIGMQQMAEGLQKAAGERLRRILEVFTSNPAMAVVTGALVTALVQSSSTTTVMTVGFVNAGLMTLSQAVGTIMGANIGTTITAQIVSFDIYQLAYPLIAIGAGLSFFAQRRIARHAGTGMLGFGLLLLGLSTMSESVYPLRTYQPFLDALVYLGQNPLLGVLAGAVFTTLVQSSSATTGLVIAFAMQGIIDLPSGLVLIIGANIGTCITAALAAIGTSLSARRAAAAHFLFNTLGALLFLIFRGPFTNLVAGTSPAVTRQIANAHTIFNVANTVILLPLIKPFVAVVKRILPGEGKEIVIKPQYLDPRMSHSPGAVLAAEKEVVRMADVAIGMVEDAVNAFIDGDLRALSNLDQREELVNDLEKAITNYLTEQTQASIDQSLSRKITNLMHVTNDIERVADHAVNISELAAVRVEHSVPLSEDAVNDITVMRNDVVLIFREAMEALTAGDAGRAKELIARDDIIDDMEKRFRVEHIRRLNEGICKTEAGILFLDLISNLERVADHANNIAEAAAGTLYPQK
jgi:phosphate:Na+ symporter